MRPQNRAEVRRWLESGNLNLNDAVILEILGFCSEAWDLGAAWMAERNDPEWWPEDNPFSWVHPDKGGVVHDYGFGAEDLFEGKGGTGLSRCCGRKTTDLPMEDRIRFDADDDSITCPGPESVLG